MESSLNFGPKKSCTNCFVPNTSDEKLQRHGQMRRQGKDQGRAELVGESISSHITLGLTLSPAQIMCTEASDRSAIQ